MKPPSQLPFNEAIDFYRQKIKLPTAGWTDIWQEQHSHAFVVAGAANDALLEDLYNGVQQAKWAGGGYDEFKQNFADIAAKHGWAYNGAPGWRSRVIYDTNITQAYNAGRYQQMQAVKHLRPYWQYDHTSIEHPRLEHKAWDGKILPADDPWWDTHYPQNGWGCKCRVHSLTRSEAKIAWEQKGLSGPDTAPPIEWEEKVVGKRSATPRVVRVPKGIDPGFAYNPGRAWKEANTVPPLDAYRDLIDGDGRVTKVAKSYPHDLSLPKPTIVDSSVKIPADTPPEKAVSDYLEIFGATIDRGVVIIDKSGTPVVISKALFIKGDEKTGDQFKWLTAPDKNRRLEYINLLAWALLDPDEIWLNWEQDESFSKENPDAPKRWRLKRRYLKVFEISDTGEYAIAAFEWGRSGWTGSTTFMAQPKNDKRRLKYFNDQRRGKLLFKK